VEQQEHLRLCPKLEVLEVGHVFAEVNHSSAFFRVIPANLYPGYPPCAPR
jgi:hypothetical protein